MSHHKLQKVFQEKTGLCIRKKRWSAWEISALLLKKYLSTALVYSGRVRPVRSRSVQNLLMLFCESLWAGCDVETKSAKIVPTIHWGSSSAANSFTKPFTLIHVHPKTKSINTFFFLLYNMFIMFNRIDFIEIFVLFKLQLYVVTMFFNWLKNIV